MSGLGLTLRGGAELDMAERLRMQHKGDDGEVLFTTFVLRELLGQSPEKVTTTYLFFLQSMDEGTVCLQTLSVEVRDLPTIDPEELIKLRICGRVLDTVRWVAEGLLRQQWMVSQPVLSPQYASSRILQAAPRLLPRRNREERRGDDELSLVTLIDTVVYEQHPLIIEQLEKDEEKNEFWSIHKEVQESLLNLKNTTNGQPRYYYGRICQYETEKTFRNNQVSNSKTAKYDLALPPRDQRHEWLRFDAQWYTEEGKQKFETRLAKIYYRKIHRVHVLDFARLGEINEGDAELDMTERYSGTIGQREEDMQTKGFRAYWEAGLRRITTKAYLVDYWTRIAFMSMDEGTVLGIHFGVITEQSLQTLTVKVRDLPTIDPEELIKLRICERVLDTVSWVVEVPPRQQVGVAGGDAQIDPEVPQDALVDQEDGQLGHAPQQTPQMPQADAASLRVDERACQLSVKGLAEYKASASNLRRIQVKYIVKEVEDYLKTYSSDGMDISWILDTSQLPPLRIQPRFSINRECNPIMSGTVPPIPPPLGTNTGNPTSPNRTDPIPVDISNNTTTTNVAQNVVNKDLPQLLD
ncbi:hypothetical protein Tco_0474734 [Tanacetum coccineum]